MLDGTLKMPILLLKGIFFFCHNAQEQHISAREYSFTLPTRITASSVKHMSAGEKKSVGESSAEAKGNAKLNITSFYVSGDAVFSPLQENME